MEQMFMETWGLMTRPRLLKHLTSPLMRPKCSMRSLSSLASSGGLRSTMGTVALVSSVTMSLWRLKKLRSTFFPVISRIITVWCTDSSSGNLKVSGLFALLAKINLLQEVNYINGTGSCLEPTIDESTTILDLDHTGSTSFFGVYDGHGGANVALYCENRFHTELLRDEDYQNNLDGAVRHVFFRMDEQLREYDEWRALARPCRRRFSFNLLNCLRAATCAKGIPYSEGSTASVALIRGNQIIVGSVGDSRCVLSRNGQAMDLSTDHKPNLPDERRRIQNAGGRVTRDTRRVWCAGQERVQLGSYRVNGLLAMSRSIGDFVLKSNGLSATEQMVTCNPDVRTADITDDTEFLLIASDGIWDILSSQGAVDFVHQKLASGTTDLRTICEGLLSHCFRSRDNSTVILVQFKPAARIPLAPPASAAPVVNPSATETSSAANPDASAEAKADSGREIEELEGPLLPLSTLPSSSQLV